MRSACLSTPSVAAMFLSDSGIASAELADSALVAGPQVNDKDAARAPEIP
jgi:hypothetical protein